MNFRNILTSFTFRFMAVYVLALSFAVFLLMAIIYGLFASNYFDNLQRSIDDELRTLALIYEGQGVGGVDRYVEDRWHAATPRRFHYLLADAEFDKLAGTLDAWPDYREFGDGWIAFGLSLTELGGAAPESELELLARRDTLGDGSHALVALRFGDVLELARLVLRTLVRTMLATVALGIVGGFFAAAASLRRIEKLNEGINDIVRGDLSQRIPVGGAMGNMRELIENFNNMLDQTESLMRGVRTLSDNIAHDLRTPLTRMRNRLSQLQGDPEGVGGEAVQELIDECDSILSTFNVLLRIGQLEAGNRPSNFVPLDLAALVRDVVELYEPLAAEKRIDLRCSRGGADCEGDRDLLFQMLANLLDNAVKYTPAGGAIRVSLTLTPEGKLLLAVADSGPGIPEADRENVFRRFFRLESSRGVHPGDGLGLSLVRAAVNLHRGEIDLSSNDPGLRVEIRLPACRSGFRSEGSRVP